MDDILFAAFANLITVTLVHIAERVHALLEFECIEVDFEARTHFVDFGVAFFEFSDFVSTF